MIVAWHTVGVCRMSTNTVLHHTIPLLRSALRQRSATGRVHRFSTSNRRCQQHKKESFRSRLRHSLSSTDITWRPIPIALGIAFLGGFQLYRTQVRDKKGHDEWTERDIEPEDDRGKPRKRKRIRPSGPWTVQIMSTLPLKALRRLWGKFNSLEIPYSLRVPGFKL